jgi:hypothetical protein
MTRRWASLLLALLGLGCEGATVSLATRRPDAGSAWDASAQQDGSQDQDPEDETDENEEECEPLLGENCTDPR